MKKSDILIREIAGWLSVVGFDWMLVMCIFSHEVVPSNIANLGYFLFGVPWLAEMIMSGRWRYHFRIEHLLSYAMILFFAFELIYLPNEGDIYLKKLMEKRYPLLLFAVTGLFGYSDKLTYKRVVDTMVAVSAFAVIAVIVNAGAWHLIVDSGRTTAFSESRTAIVNAHMMFNFYLNAAFIGMWWIWFRCGEKTKWRGVLYSAATLLTLFALVFGDGRSGLLIFIALVVTFVAIGCWSRFRWKTVLILVMLAGIGSAIVMCNARFRQYGFHNEAREGYWKAAFELIEKKPLMGYGVNNAQEEYDKVNMKYQTDDMPHLWYIENNCTFIDTHNQFIQSTLEFGLVGLLVLLSLYVLPVVVADRKCRILVLILVAMSLLQSMTDMFITGQFCTLYCILTQSAIAFSQGNRQSISC